MLPTSRHLHMSFLSALHVSQRTHRFGCFAGCDTNSAERSTMSATEGSNRGRRRVLLVAAPFVAGAAVGAGVLSGHRDHDGSTAPYDRRSGHRGNDEHRPDDVEFDAATIYTRDSPGVVDITVTVAAGQGGSRRSRPGGSQQARPRERATSTTRAATSSPPTTSSAAQRRSPSGSRTARRPRRHSSAPIRRRTRP